MMSTMSERYFILPKGRVCKVVFFLHIRGVVAGAAYSKIIESIFIKSKYDYKNLITWGNS